GDRGRRADGEAGGDGRAAAHDRGVRGGADLRRPGRGAGPRGAGADRRALERRRARGARAGARRDAAARPLAGRARRGRGVGMSFTLRVVGSLLARPARRLRYGAHRDQNAELFLPRGDGPFALVVVLHGGWWQARRTRTKLY